MIYSVVIPTYNSEEYIESCIFSALACQPEDVTVDIIVVDDCSTDNTVNFIDNLFYIVTGKIF